MSVLAAVNEPGVTVGQFEIAFGKMVVLGIMFLGSAFTFYSLRIKQKALEKRDLLEHEIEALREENAEQRAAFDARIAEMEERLDFVERRIVQPRPEPKRIEPRIVTPV